VCAHISNGSTLDQVGERVDIETLVRLIPLVPSGRNGHVVHIDKFGNLITNIAAGKLQRGDGCWLNNTPVARVAKTYSSVSATVEGKETGPRVHAFIGSHGYLEIGAFQARAVDLCRAAIGDPVRLESAC
jgi:S-adenosylmethionine hydrolase